MRYVENHWCNKRNRQNETCPEKIRQCFQKYYKSLYSQPQTSNDNQIDKDKDRPKITSEKTLHVMKHITEQRLETLILSLDAEKAFRLSEMVIFI